MDRTVTMDKVVNLCKRRGLIFASSEIYGGLGSCWDYGPLGAELKRNVRDAWWQAIVRERTDVVGLDSAILMHPRVWEASGHVEGFTDPLVDCRQCKERFRTDELPTLLRCTACEGQVRTGADEAALRVLEKQQGPQARTAAEEAPLADESDRCAHCGRTATLVSAMSWCPRCGSGDLTDARQFNLMFKTFLGAVEDSAHVAYLRPETAQGIFVNFLNVLNAARQKIPFGIAQIGKSFRNEITPGNFVFRTREFEQMEIEYFVSPGTDEQWFEYWSGERLRWYRDLGIRPEHLRVRPHGPEELAHYAKACVDIEYRFPFGWAELEGIANRTDFDLRRHAEYSGRDLTYFDEETRERYIPYVIEPSGGVDRTVLAFLVDAYDEDAVEGETRTVLRLHPRLAPVKAAVLPLLRKDGHPERAREIFDRLRRRLAAAYDQAGSIGRRYRRQDEIGTPFGITVDHQTLADGTVTLRERDSTQQIRIPADDIVAELQRRIDET